MKIELRWLAPDEIDRFQEAIVGVYRDAFSPPPYEKEEAEVASFAMTFPRQYERHGYRFLAALAGPDDLVGFTYGHTAVPGQWWYEHVAPMLPPGMVINWLAGSFELVELAVAPRAQGRGVGGRLHDTLLAAARAPRAVLSTLDADTVAFRLYRKRGWVTLIDRMFFPGVDRPYRIMGKELAPGEAHEEEAE